VAVTGTLCVNGSVWDGTLPEPGIVSTPETKSVSLEVPNVVCGANARLTVADPPALMVVGAGLITLNCDPAPEPKANCRPDIAPVPVLEIVTMRLSGVPIAMVANARTPLELTENVSGAGADATPDTANVCVNGTELSVPATVSVSR
jgi:hypothetical protein